MSAVRGGRRTAGFTMVELMVSVAILGVVLVYVFESFVRQQKAYSVTEQIVKVAPKAGPGGEPAQGFARVRGCLHPGGAIWHS